MGRKHTFKSVIRSESLHKISNGNKVRVANFATFKSLIVRSTGFPHRSVYKFTLTSPDGKTHNQVDFIARDRRWLLYVHRVSDVRQLEMRTAEPSVPEPGPLEVAITIERYIPAELIRAGSKHYI
jgi:hypothetical protein